MENGAEKGARRLRDRVYRAPSPIHGDGCYARIAFSSGEYIGTYEGPEARRDGTYVLWVYEEGRTPIGRSGRNLLRYLNHDEDGNAEFDGFDLYACRDISAGEEVTFDYQGDLVAKESGGGRAEGTPDSESERTT